MASGEDWRKNADTHKMSPEEVKRLGLEGSKRRPGSNPGGILHQKQRLPYSFTTITLGSVAAANAALWYFTLYAKKKPEATAGDVARAAFGAGNPEETHPRK